MFIDATRPGTTLKPRKWYASRCALAHDFARTQFGLDGPPPWRLMARLWESRRGEWVLTLRGLGLPPRQLDVTGRSMRHVDRLARDWIGHGVSPTRDGGRGVGSPYGQVHVALPDLNFLDRFDAAERRAARVVFQ